MESKNVIAPVSGTINPRPDFAKHPCFNEDARCTSARIHLPVAPRCNVQCKFCNRDFSCANESRPGVTAAVLSPQKAVERLREVAATMDSLSVVGIAGPGDPFANPVETMETLRLIRQEWPGMILCVATNGLGLLPHVDALAELQVSHVTLTINAVDPAIGAGIYDWMRYGKGTHMGEEGAAWLLDQQLQSIKALKERGMIVKVNTIAIPEVNMDHVVAVGKTVAALGADVHNIIPLIPVAGTGFGHLKAPEASAIDAMRKELAGSIKQMSHCRRCRADAIGLLDKNQTMDDIRALQSLKAESASPAGGCCSSAPATGNTAPGAAVPAPAVSLAVDSGSGASRVAVATMEGIFVNQHLGEALEIHVFDAASPEAPAAEVLRCPTPGGGDERWKELARLLGGCSHLLVSGIGPRPLAVMEEAGIKVLVLEGMVSEALENLAAGRDPVHMARSEAFSCGSSCSGSGTGCG